MINSTEKVICHNNHFNEKPCANCSKGFKPQDVPIHILCDTDLVNHASRERRSAYRSYRDEVTIQDVVNKYIHQT